jgi:hypothetical protein
VTAQLLVGAYVNGVVVVQRQCPLCGHLIYQPGPDEHDREAMIDSLREEIRHLQETIAYLRGSLGSPARPAR